MGPTPTDGAGSGTGSSTAHFKPGDKVEARWGETTWYPATVTADNGDWVNGNWHTNGTYEVEYDDGEVRSYTAERIRRRSMDLTQFAGSSTDAAVAPSTPLSELSAIAVPF